MKLVEILNINENIIEVYYVKDINLCGKDLIDIFLKTDQSIK